MLDGSLGGGEELGGGGVVAVGGCRAGVSVAVVRERLGVGQLPASLLAGFGEPYGGGHVAEVDGMVRELVDGVHA
ncbi:hypothetical protein [Streptomyces sp. bgisy027]|uniref:hypothetical protein n=1 Tax=Streptomyces sp. bgisy027 TaxID=3413770 RepID=UPI003D728550